MIGFWLGRASVGRPSHRAGPLGILAYGILAYAIIRALGPWAWGITAGLLVALVVGYGIHLRDQWVNNRPSWDAYHESYPEQVEPSTSTAVRCWHCGGPDGEGGRCRWCGARSV